MNENEQHHIEVSVDCVVFGFNNNKLHILLIEQESSNPSKINRFAIPGDLIRKNEHINSAAKRVLNELTKLQNIYLKQFHVFGNPMRLNKTEDQIWLKKVRQNPDARVITIAYFALVNMNDFNPEPSSYATSTKWVDIQSIPELAFDHNKIVLKAIETLQEDVFNNRIGFELLPEKFTLSKLQQLYEVILNKSLDKRNFRKSIKKLPFIEALDEKQKDVFHKPAQLYTYNKELNNSVN